MTLLARIFEGDLAKVGAIGALIIGSTAYLSQQSCEERKEMKAELAAIEARQDKRFDAVDKRLDNVEQRMDRLEQRVNCLSGQMLAMWQIHDTEYLDKSRMSPAAYARIRDDAKDACKNGGYAGYELKSDGSLSFLGFGGLQTLSYTAGDDLKSLSVDRSDAPRVDAVVREVSRHLRWTERERGAFKTALLDELGNEPSARGLVVYYRPDITAGPHPEQ